MNMHITFRTIAKGVGKTRAVAINGISEEELKLLQYQHDIAWAASESFHGPRFRRSKESYFEHIKRVYNADEVHADIVFTPKQKILALLHDLIEDSDGLWKIEDFRNIGFEEDILEALEALTKNKDEKYLDYIERVGRNDLARMVKIADNRDNHTDFPSESRKKLYSISSKYLWAIEFGSLPAGSNIKDYAIEIGKFDSMLFSKFYTKKHALDYISPAP